jgi:hypothetical protein
MSLTTGPKFNFPKPEKSWWERQKEDYKERLRLAAFIFPEMALETWLTLGLFDLSIVTLVSVWAVGALLPILAFPIYAMADDDSPPAWVATFAHKFSLMDWFGFEFRSFIARILLFAFVITCVAGLVSVGISEELAVVTALGLVALSLPAFLVYAVLSQSEEDEEA